MSASHKRESTRGVKSGLDNMRALMNELNFTEPPTIHVAGTNGKGSVCAYLQAVLRVAGYNVGLYTSPYLERFEERIRLNGNNIEEDALVHYANLVQDKADKLRCVGVFPTVFELTTAIGFMYLSERKADISVVEVGIGGRLDSTNIITPLASCVTSIGLDHTKLLGGTIAEIAREKAGIAKEGVPLVLYPNATHEIISAAREICGKVRAKLITFDGCLGNSFERTERGTFNFHIPNGEGLLHLNNVALPLLGNHQASNAATALATLAALNNAGFSVPIEAMRSGIERARWPGRLEHISHQGKTIILDGAHNAHAAQALREYIIDKRLVGMTAIIGMMKDKDPESFAKQTAGLFGTVYTVAPNDDRATPPSELARVFDSIGTKATPCGSFAEALRLAADHDSKGGAILVTGSLYLVGEARTYLAAPPCGLLAP